MPNLNVFFCEHNLDCLSGFIELFNWGQRLEILLIQCSTPITGSIFALIWPAWTLYLLLIKLQIPCSGKQTSENTQRRICFIVLLILIITIITIYTFIAWFHHLVFALASSLGKFYFCFFKIILCIIIDLLIYCFNSVCLIL